MSDSKFTPGPWFVEQSEKTPIYVSPVGRHENISICNVLTMDEDDSESGDWINGEETKANAKLIAAAPDLLAALIELESGSGKSPGSNKKYAAARAAIEKAIA